MEGKLLNRYRTFLTIKSRILINSSSLQKITIGEVMLPTKKSTKRTSINDQTILIYGSPKVGKSTFCSYFDNALFAAFESGHNFLEIYKTDIKSWQEFLKLCALLIAHKHDFKTLIIDTVDIAHKLLTEDICVKEGITDISELGFGKGYTKVRNEFSRVIRKLTMYGIAVVFISHEITKEAEVGRRKIMLTDCSLPGSFAKDLKAMCDQILYFYFNEGGERKIRCIGTANVVAGDRSGKLPEIMDMNYEQIKERLEQ
jgi:hypothetical protein